MRVKEGLTIILIFLGVNNMNEPTQLYILTLDGIPRDSVVATSFLEAYQKMYGVWNFSSATFTWNDGGFMMYCGNQTRTPSETGIQDAVDKIDLVANRERYNASKWYANEKQGCFDGEQNRYNY